MKEWVYATLSLAVILNLLFFPVLWMDQTLLLSVRDAPSIMPSGAYARNPADRATPRPFGRTPDAGAPAWLAEPYSKLLSQQYWTEHELPLWNPYTAYGAPLAAAMQPQPFYPLSVLLSLNPTPWAYNLFLIGRLLLAGLLTFLFARLFLEFLPALFAAIAFMLTGYLALFLSMPHLSVEVLLPGLFLVFEVLLRKNSWGAVAGAAGMILVATLGGMPESLFLAVSFACLFVLFRLASVPEFRTTLTSRLWKFAAAISLGFALSAFLLLPFLEFMAAGHDAHRPSNVGGRIAGLLAYPDLGAAITYFLPLIAGPVFSGRLGVRGYWGLLASIFAATAMIVWLFPRRTKSPAPLPSLTFFFSLSLVLLILKHFGHPIINWIGALPISNLVIYVKYQEPLMAFCVAMLAAIGFSHVTERHAYRHLLAAAGIVLGIVLALAALHMPELRAVKDVAPWYYVSALSGVIVSLGAIILLSLPSKRFPYAALGVVSLLVAELSFNFIVPSFYAFNSLPRASETPYAGAPYIDFLRAQNRDHYRIFARQNVLFPNWAGAFELADVRGLDAMYYRRYMDFIRSFLGTPGDARLQGDLANRFTGADPKFSYAFDTETERRFLALSSVKYLISVSEYGSTANVAGEIFAQHRSEHLWGLGPGTFDVNGRAVQGLFHHPPSKRLSYTTTIRADRPVLEGTAVIREDAIDKSDGVGFLIEVESDDRIEPLFSTFLNPKEVSAARAGHPFSLDLSRFAGKPVKLLFSTDPGPSGSNGWDWAGWAGLRFAPASGVEKSGPFREVYDKEVRIYEVSKVLPRASLFHNAEILPDGDVLQRLKQPSFDPFHAVALSREGLSDRDLTILQSIKPDAAGGTAKISRYESQHVAVEVDTPSPAVLMLNDSNYPGWLAYVDGKPAPLLKADYLFRGVIVPAGKSTVEFAYEPVSFRAGALISLGALLLLLLPFVIRRGVHLNRAGAAPT
ncbi:YfhO family protein [Methyloceanibacter sp.]|uniref:YfhO family protein n=1 Tax=Methyloceanibacter sp. TaxID=1965321 RepID=UPI003D6D8A04